MRGPTAFARVLTSGHRVEGACLQLLVRHAAGETGCVGYIVSARHIRRAVDRNKVKRVLREAVRCHRATLQTYDIVLRVRQGKILPCTSELAAEASRLLDTLEQHGPR